MHAVQPPLASHGHVNHDACQNMHDGYIVPCSAGEALKLMMCYAIRYLDVKGFIAKILEKNEPSINLFSRLHFREAKRVEGVSCAA